MKKILITGATGFIGHHLVKKLLNNNDYDIAITFRKTILPSMLNNWGKSLLSYRVDLTNTNKVKEILQEYQPNVIIHLAANPMIKIDEDNPSDIINTNVLITQNLCHYATNQCRFLFASSIVVYGDTNHRCKENHVCNPISVYGATKLASESIINAYSSQKKIVGTSLRLCATVGTGLTHGIVFDFINKLKENKNYLEVLGAEPGTYKPYSHIEDVIQAFEIMIEKELNSKYNVVPNDSINVKEVAQSVMGGLGIIKPIKWLGEASRWSGDNNILMADNQRLKYREWKPKYPTSKCAIVKAVENINAL